MNSIAGLPLPQELAATFLAARSARGESRPSVFTAARQILGCASGHAVLQRFAVSPHAYRYSRILGKSVTRTSPFWLVNVSVWSALCACATPEMR
jgi:hypothetical protein